MKRVKWAALIIVSLLITAALLARFVWLDHWLNNRLAALQRRTGIRATFETMHLSFESLTLQKVSLFWDKETTPSAVTDEVDIRFFDKEMRFSDLRFNRNNVRAALRGKVHLSKNTLDIVGSLPPVSCEQLLLAMPPSMQARLQGVKLGGRLGLDFHFRLDEARPKRNVLDVDLDNGCTILGFGALPTPDAFRKPFVQRALDENKKPFDRTMGPGSDDWVDFDDISPYMREAVIEAEDPLFLRHDGVLLSRIATAAKVNLRAGVFRYGASTITMQTAKNLFLSREKTFERKLLELFFVWYLESNFTKDEILTLYLNLAEMGPSVYGVADAAHYYFGVRPQDLNLRQSAFLAKLLPRPLERSRARELKQVPPDNARRIRALLSDMLKAKRITREEYDEALRVKISFKDAGKTPVIPPPSDPMQLPQNHIRRASRPRLQELPPPLSKLLSGRREQGADLDRPDAHSSL